MVSGRPEKIIFLDFDGPLTHALNILATRDHLGFDSQTLKALNKICAYTGAKIVCSSTRAPVNNEVCKQGLIRMFSEGGLDSQHIHDDWSCQYSLSDDSLVDRKDCIHQWLLEHPEVQTYVVIDDEPCDIPFLVQVSELDGMLLKDFEAVASGLGIKLSEVFAYNGAHKKEQVGPSAPITGLSTPSNP